MWRGTRNTWLRGASSDVGIMTMTGNRDAWRSRTSASSSTAPPGASASTQHLANALAPIRAEGGLPVGADRIMPRLLLVGRDARAARRPSRRRYGAEDWTTDLDAALAQPDFSGLLRRRGDQAARCGADQGDCRRQAHLQRKAGGAVGGRGACALARGARARAQSRRGRGQDQSAGLAETSARSRASGFFGRVTGFRLDFGWWVFDGAERDEPAAELELPQERRRRTDQRHGPALALRDRRHSRPHPPRGDGDADRDPRARGRGAASVSRSMSTTRRSRSPNWRTARSARSSAPGRRGCGATIC